MEDLRIDILKTIMADTENDAKEFDGKEFNGKNVAEYLGNQGAAIQAIARILSEVMQENTHD